MENQNVVCEINESLSLIQSLNNRKMFGLLKDGELYGHNMTLRQAQNFSNKLLKEKGLEPIDYSTRFLFIV